MGDFQSSRPMYSPHNYETEAGNEYVRGSEMTMVFWATQRGRVNRKGWGT